MAEASTVTLADAVTREAMVEERKVMEEHVRKEEAEDNAMTRKRPWWMGFFFLEGSDVTPIPLLSRFYHTMNV